MGGEDLNVDPEALKAAEKGINDTIGELNDMGMLGSGETGRGFGSLSLTGMEAGSQRLSSSVSDFADRWGWGVRALVADANQIAQSLGMAAGIYHDVDSYVADSANDAGKLIAGNPHASSEQLENESWSQIAKDNSTMDYSSGSFSHAMDQSKQAWESAGKDIYNTEKERLTDPGQYYKDEFDAARGKQPDQPGQPDSGGG